jgi:prolyl oligopeptidase
MHPRRAFLFAACLLLPSLAFGQAAIPHLPVTPKHSVTDEYHGVKVADDYRWLENGKDPAVVAWTEMESAHTRAVLDALPLRTEIAQFLKALDNSAPPAFFGLQMRGGMVFALYIEPQKQQPILVTLRSFDDLASRKIVLDPMQIDSTNSTAIQFYVPSPDGSKVAVSLAQGGTEAGSMHVYDVATGQALPDVVPHVTAIGGGSVAWAGDGSGFYYTHYPNPGERSEDDLNFYQQIYFHKLGTEPPQDTYAIGKDFPRIAETVLSTSEDGKYVLATVENGDGPEYEHFLCGPDGKWTQITQFSDSIKAVVVGNDGIYMLSRDQAPRGKLLRAPLDSPALKSATVILPQTSAVLQDFTYTLAGMQPTFLPTATRLYVTELLGGPMEIHIFDHNGHDLGVVPSEPVSTITHILLLQGDDILFGNTSYVSPTAWFRYDPASKNVTPTAIRETSPFSAEGVEVVREFAISKDGTKVPMTILRHKGTKLDGKHPTILTGYGGFGISSTPGFDPVSIAWLDSGGVFVIANLRGGAEYGEEWHQQGMLTHKQNVFDDFIACAEYLIKARYTNPSELGIQGGSNGGLLMGAVLTQRPDLFRVVVSDSGLYDMLRSETTQNGQYNLTEYGSVKDEAQFKALYAYSPYHHVESGMKYPAVLLMVGSNDPRVDPWHSRKFAAALQAATSSNQPILFIAFSNAGHGGIGSSEDQQISMGTYFLEFLYDQLGVKFVSPPMSH